MADFDRAQWEAYFDEDWERAHHAERGNSPTWWMGSADKLLAVVRLLGPTVDAAQREALEFARINGGEAFMARPYGDDLKAAQPLVMIRAMAVECRLKALWIKRNGPMVKNGKFKGPKTHDLATLAASAGLGLRPEEVAILAKLTLWLTVHGRYPIGLEWDYDRKVRAQTGDLGPISSWGAGDSRACDQFLEDLEVMIAGARGSAGSQPIREDT